MQWQDEGIVLAVRRHGENAAIAEVMTATHGRTMGLVRGGRSKRLRPVLQAGNRVSLIWRARLEDHLGQFTLEPVTMQAARLIDDPLALAGLNSITGLCRLLAEREPHDRLYQALDVVISHLDDVETWPVLMVRWELGLLEELGFGLDLTSCAATGQKNDLVYISPKSARAVSRQAGLPYHDRLLPLPAFMLKSDSSAISPQDVKDGFALTGYFLNRHVLEPRDLEMPSQRSRIMRHF